MFAAETTDRMLLRQTLAPRPLRAAYMLGDLDPAYFPFTRWWIGGEEPGDLPTAVVLLYGGLRLPLVLTHGDPHALEAPIEAAAAESPGQVYLQIEREHDAVLARHFDLGDLQSICRMGLQRAGYSSPDLDLGAVERLGHADTGGLMALYSFYPDAFFEPYQLGSGFYFGVRAGDDLVSVAGVHVVSVEFQVAVIGNVVTHPEHRGRGLARRCVARLVEALFEKVPAVALNVRSADTGARRTFASLGFAEHADFLQGIATKRDC